MFRVAPVSFIVVLCCLIFLIFRTSFFKNYIYKALYYPTLQNVSKKKFSWKEKYFYIPKLFLMSGFIQLLFSFTDPHLIKEKKELASQRAKEGLALFLALDRSGSMAQSLLINQDNQLEKIQKFEFLKTITEQFIRSLPNDLIGLVTFARSTQIISPLTLDHQFLLNKIKSLKVIQNKELDGTAIGYAIYKTAHLITSLQEFQKQMDSVNYDIKSAFIVILTDGLQDPNPLDKGNKFRTIELEEAANYAKKHKIKVYIVNLDPRINEEQFLPNRKQMMTVTKNTGGDLFVAQDLSEVPKLLATIEQNEKSTFPIEKTSTVYEKKQLFPYFILSSFAFMFVGLLLEKSIWRKIP